MEISSSFFTNLSQLFRLNQAQELIFALALRNSIHEPMQRLAKEHLQQHLPELIQRTADGIHQTGLADLSVEVIHSILQSNSSDIEREIWEKFLDRLRKG